MSNSQQTQQAYFERGIQLWVRCAKGKGISPDELEAGHFLDWLESILPGLLPPTRRLYLLAAKYLLGNQEHFHNKQPGDIHEAAKRVSGLKACDFGDASSSRALKRKYKTSRQKAKKVERADLLQIMEAARLRASQWAKPACIWLLANAIVGLRPAEWRTAKVEIKDGNPFLVVQNAKFNENRGNGAARAINLALMGSGEANIVVAQLRIAGTYSKTDQDWDRYYSGCRKVLYKITRKIWPCRWSFPTLYTGRHQFSANAKSAGLTKEEIAALMGHSSLDTAGEHYGKTKWGSGELSVRPSQEDVERVNEREAVRSKNREETK